MRPVPPIAFFTLFCLGTLAVVGYVLAASNGLSESHKTVLVGFLVAFPTLNLFIFLTLLGRDDKVEAVPFRRGKSDLTPEPFQASVNRS